MKKHLVKVLLLLIWVAGGLFRFYKLDVLPGEIFGDISQNLEHINSVLSKDWRLIYGYDGREGLWFYLAAINAKLFGDNYLSLKLTAALIGLLTVVTIFVMATKLENLKVGIVAAILVAISKWSVVFSRIGFRVVLIPLFISLLITVYLKAMENRKRWWAFILTGIIAGVGMYTYPAFKFAVLGLILLTLVNLYKKPKIVIGQHIIMWLIFGVIVCPMIIDLQKNSTQYTEHTRQMLVTDSGKLREDWLVVFETNIINQLMAFNIKGDVVFRVNPPYQPLLDPISGVCLIIGVMAWILEKKKNKLIVWSFFILMQLPSVLVLNNPIDIPSATRSLGVTPFIYLLAASGLCWTVSKITGNKIKRTIILTMTLVIIGAINWKNYFSVYAFNLPNHNVAYDREIAKYAEKIPSEITVTMVDCCWADWGSPEPEGVKWWLKNQKRINYVSSEGLEEISNDQKMVYILPPNFDWTPSGFIREDIVDNYGVLMFKVVKNF